MATPFESLTSRMRQDGTGVGCQEKQSIAASSVVDLRARIDVEDLPVYFLHDFSSLKFVRTNWHN